MEGVITEEGVGFCKNGTLVGNTKGGCGVDEEEGDEDAMRALLWN